MLLHHWQETALVSLGCQLTRIGEGLGLGGQGLELCLDLQGLAQPPSLKLVPPYQDEALPAADIHGREVLGHLGDLRSINVGSSGFAVTVVVLSSLQPWNTNILWAVLSTFYPFSPSRVNLHATAFRPTFDTVSVMKLDEGCASAWMAFNGHSCRPVSKTPFCTNWQNSPPLPIQDGTAATTDQH